MQSESTLGMTGSSTRNGAIRFFLFYQGYGTSRGD